MFAFDQSRNYLLHILLPGQCRVLTATSPGEHLEDLIIDYQRMYPDYRKIVVYDDETHEAIGIIKNEL